MVIGLEIAPSQNPLGYNDCHTSPATQLLLGDNDGGKFIQIGVICFWRICNPALSYSIGRFDEFHCEYECIQMLHLTLLI